MMDEREMKEEGGGLRVKKRVFEKRENWRGIGENRK
jgi:hypothetical protein